MGCELISFRTTRERKGSSFVRHSFIDRPAPPCPSLPSVTGTFYSTRKNLGGLRYIPFMDGIRQFYNKIIFYSMVDRIRKSMRTAVGALSILHQPPPPGFFMLRAMRSALGATSHSLSCPSPPWSPHWNDRKNEAGLIESGTKTPPRPVLIWGFVPGGLIGVVSRGIGCAFVGQ